MTSSAVANSVSGMARPSALAVLRLMTNSIFVKLHRQIGWLFAFEDATGVPPDDGPAYVIPDAVADQAASQDELAVLGDRGQRMAGRQFRELFHTSAEE